MDRWLLFWIGRLNKRTGWSWSRLHPPLYRMLGGRVVGSLRGRRVALLTTQGRTSGLPRTVPVTFMRHGDDYVVMASYRPQWYRNLLAQPRAGLQVRRRRLTVTASVSEDPDLREEFRRYYPALTLIEERVGVGGPNARSAAAEVPVIVLSPDRTPRAPTSE